MAFATDEERQEFYSKSGWGVDFILRTGKFSWKVHSKVLSEHSPVFRVACYGAFKENAENIISLPDETPATVARLLQWMYRSVDCEYDGWGGRNYDYLTRVQDMLKSGYRRGKFHRDWDAQRMVETAESEKPLAIFATLYCVAEKYGIVDLQKKIMEYAARVLKSQDEGAGREYSRSSFWAFFDTIPDYLVEKDELTRRCLADIAGFAFDVDGRLTDKRMRDLLNADKGLSIIINEQLYSRYAQMDKTMDLTISSIKSRERALDSIESAIEDWVQLKKEAPSEIIRPPTPAPSGWWTTLDS